MAIFKAFKHEMVQPHTTSNFLLAMDNIHIVVTIGHGQQPANNQPYKDGKMASLGSQPESIIAFQDLRFYQCWWHLVAAHYVIVMVASTVLLFSLLVTCYKLFGADSFL